MIKLFSKPEPEPEPETETETETEPEPETENPQEKGVYFFIPCCSEYYIYFSNRKETK
jgi:hypothetical protein